jgi:hypothetical protein
MTDQRLDETVIAPSSASVIDATVTNVCGAK